MVEALRPFCVFCVLSLKQTSLTDMFYTVRIFGCCAARIRERGNGLRDPV
jgi:hypothetical protein